MKRPSKAPPDVEPAEGVKQRKSRFIILLDGSPLLEDSVVKVLDTVEDAQQFVLQHVDEECCVQICEIVAEKQLRRQLTLS